MRFVSITGLLFLCTAITAQNVMTKEQADEICVNDPAYGPNYQACMGGPNGAPSACVCKPTACLQPCFGSDYTLPDGTRGCCPQGQTYSLDDESGQGACCGNGTSFSWDPISQTGGCCDGIPVPSFVGTCAAPTPPAPLTPCTSPFPPSVQVGGKNFINYTGLATYGTNLNNGGSAKTFADCQSLCAADDNCVAIDFIKSPPNCFPKSDKNDKVPGTKDPNVDSAINPPCMQQGDNCPAIANTIRVYGGVAYTFKCGFQLGFGNVIPTFTTPDLYTCIQKCSANAKCQGVNYPVKGGQGPCNLKSNYEPSPGASANYVAAIPLVARG